MNMTDFVYGLKKFGLKIWDHKEDIAFIAGTAGTMTGTYLFVKASKKNEPVVNAYKAEKERIESDESLSEEEKTKLTKKNSVSAFKGSVRSYAIPLVVSGAGYGLQIWAVIRKNSKIKDVSTALTTSLAAFEVLKENIIAAEGEEKWNEYAYGQKVTKTTEVDMETGEVNELVNVELGGVSLDFSFPFDGRLAPDGTPICTTYQEAKGANKTFLSILENSWEDKLQRTGKNGYIFLRPVWESIFGTLNQFPKEWSNAGWPAMNADGTINHISFGFRPVGSRANDPAINAFWDEKVQDVRITFEGLVPDLYKVF